MKRLAIVPEIYQQQDPYPFVVQDHFLEEDVAKEIQREILAIPPSEWDRYKNPFESKYTLRDKYNFPPHLRSLFEKWESREWIDDLSRVCGYSLRLDPTRNFWGVHQYDSGDKLDIHVDAGIHPVTKQKKQVTIGLYLSLDWKEGYGCELELWRGDEAYQEMPQLKEKVLSITPLYNRFVMFTCTDHSWHGNPIPANGPNDAKRIFVTMSYLSDNEEDKNKRQKAYFIARPSDPVDEEKDRLRQMRADPEKYKEVYRT